MSWIKTIASRCRKVWSEHTAGFAAAFGFIAIVLVGVIVTQATALHSRGWTLALGTIPETFAAIGTVAAVAVALWQSIVIRRQAEHEATDAAKRFEQELTSARELHAAEMKAADERHKAELETQREIARVQRVHLREQEFKLALIRVSRAASAYTHELATLVAETQRIVNLPTRQERDDAMKPIAKKMNLASHDLGLEVSGAHMLTNNDNLHAALDRIMQEALEGPIRGNEYENTVVTAGETPNAAPIFMAMEAINRVVGDARRLAGELLVTGWD